jgi:hypothetical protein
MLSLLVSISGSVLLSVDPQSLSVCIPISGSRLSSSSISTIKITEFFAATTCAAFAAFAFLDAFSQFQKGFSTALPALQTFFLADFAFFVAVSSFFLCSSSSLLLPLTGKACHYKL